MVIEDGVVDPVKTTHQGAHLNSVIVSKACKVVMITALGFGCTTPTYVVRVPSGIPEHDVPDQYGYLVWKFMRNLNTTFTRLFHGQLPCRVNTGRNINYLRLCSEHEECLANII